MKKIYLFIAFFIFKFSYSQKTIYYGNNGFYKVYFDDSKLIKIVEIYGIKFGYYDTINYANNEQVNISKLFTKNNINRYIYKNSFISVYYYFVIKNHSINKRK